MITNNKEHAKQIVHEAEVTRQQSRYKIPCKVEIDGKIFVLDNWSLGGFAVKNALKEFCLHPMKRAKMLFKFDTFETAVDNIQVEFACKGKTPQGDIFPLLGAKFHNLDSSQIAILNQIISSYINGDIITEEDILYAATRNISYEKKEAKKIDRKKTDKILILIYSAVFLVFSFVGYIAYYRTFVVETVNGYVDTNMTVIRAPYLSYIDFTKKYKIGEEIEENETIAIAHFIDGTMQPILSPLQGKIFKVNVLENEFRNTGEPIMSLIDANATLYITAKVDHKFIKKLKIGDIAKVRTENNRLFQAKIMKILPAQQIDAQKVKIVENIYNKARDYDNLLLSPIEPIEPELLNSAVFVTIDTFWQQ